MLSKERQKTTESNDFWSTLGFLGRVVGVFVVNSVEKNIKHLFLESLKLVKLFDDFCLVFINSEEPQEGEEVYTFRRSNPELASIAEEVDELIRNETREKGKQRIIFPKAFHSSA